MKAIGLMLIASGLLILLSLFMPKLSGVLVTSSLMVFNAAVMVRLITR
jgi:hypothetical protein